MPFVSHSQSQTGAEPVRRSIQVGIVDSNSYTRSRMVETIGAEKDFVIRQFKAASEMFTTVRPDEKFVCLIHQPTSFNEHVDEYVLMRKKYAQIGLLLVSEPCPAVLAKALCLGFRGYYAENIDSYNLVAAIRAVHHGTIWLSGIVDIALEQVAHSYKPPKSLSLAPDCQLSDREKTVLSYIAAGLTNREIAENLFVSVATVKANLRSVFRKLQVNDRTHAAVVAWEKGLIVREKEPIQTD